MNVILCGKKGRMKMDKEIVLTYNRLKELEAELEYLKTEKRKEVSEKIKVARGFGDLSENAEYDEAKKEQGEVEVKIVSLEKMLKNAKAVSYTHLLYLLLLLLFKKHVYTTLI